MFAIFKLYKTALVSKRWIAYTAILSISLSYDISSNVDSFTFEQGLFLGLTGILPLVYLFILGSVDDIAVLARTKSPNLKTLAKIPTIFTEYRKAWIWFVVLCWVGINVGLYFAWDTVLLYIAGYDIAFFLYGLGQLWRAFQNREDRTKWSGYLLTVGSCTAGDYSLTQGLLLSTVPFMYLVGYRISRKDHAFIKAYFPELLHSLLGMRDQPSSHVRNQV
jgi:hypothetical protein